MKQTREHALQKVLLKFQNDTSFSQRINIVAYIDSKMF